MSSNGDPRRSIANRLKRARGQLDGVIAAVEEGKSCRDVVMQLSAVSSALDRAGYAIVASAMRNCVSEDGLRQAGADEGLTADELEKIFLMLA